MTHSQEVSRRDFISVVVGATAAVITACIGIPAIAYLISPAFKVKAAEDWIAAGPLENYPVGVPTLFTFTRSTTNGWEKTVTSHGVYVLNQGNEQIQALSNMCTHLSCRVSWKDDQSEYVCPCHDAHFDIAGNVVSGPPPKPMVPYETRVEEGTLFIHYVEG
jgi:Rieske Fe-S protein